MNEQIYTCYIRAQSEIINEAEHQQMVGLFSDIEEAKTMLAKIAGGTIKELYKSEHENASDEEAEKKTRWAVKNVKRSIMEGRSVQYSADKSTVTFLIEPIINPVKDVTVWLLNGRLAESGKLVPIFNSTDLEDLKGQAECLWDRIIDPDLGYATGFDALVITCEKTKEEIVLDTTQDVCCSIWKTKEGKNDSNA